jgi:hypothetical protein
MGHASTQPENNLCSARQHNQSPAGGEGSPAYVGLRGAQLIAGASAARPARRRPDRPLLRLLGGVVVAGNGVVLVLGAVGEHRDRRCVGAVQYVDDAGESGVVADLPGVMGPVCRSTQWMMRSPLRAGPLCCTTA